MSDVLLPPLSWALAETFGRVAALVRRRMREPPRGGGGNGHLKAGQSLNACPDLREVSVGLLMEYTPSGVECWVGMGWSSGCEPPRISHGSEPALFTPTCCEQTGHSRSRNAPGWDIACTAVLVLSLKKKGIVSASASHSWEELGAPGRWDMGICWYSSIA